MEKLESNFVDNHVSFVYEQICAEIFIQLCKEERIDFTISKIGAYWNGNTQIDVVAIDNQHKRIFAGECKFYEKPVGVKVYSELVEKCETIPEFKGYDVYHGIFSKSGFEEQLVNIAKSNSKVILINRDEHIH